MKKSTAARRAEILAQVPGAVFHTRTVPARGVRLAALIRPRGLPPVPSWLLATLAHHDRVMRVARRIMARDRELLARLVD